MCKLHVDLVLDFYDPSAAQHYLCVGLELDSNVSFLALSLKLWIFTTQLKAAMIYVYMEILRAKAFHSQPHI